MSKKDVGNSMLKNILTKEQFNLYNILISGKPLEEISKELNKSLDALKKRIKRINTKLYGTEFKTIPYKDNERDKNHINFKLNRIKEKVLSNKEKISVNNIEKELVKLKADHQLEIEGYKQQIKQLRKSNTKEFKEEAQFLHQQKMLEGAVRPYIPLDIITQKPSVFNIVKKSEMIASLMFSDTHIGEVVEPEGILELNAYNPEIAAERIDTLFNRVMSTINHMAGIDVKTLNIWGLGDLVSGDPHVMHPQEMLANSDAIYDQLVMTSDYIGQFIRNLAPHFEKINFVGVPGNHGRLTKKMGFKQVWNNHDSIAMHITSLMCKDIKNVSFKLPRSMFSLEKIYDEYALLMHGNGIRSHSGTPYYGIDRAGASLTQALALLKKAGKILNYIIMGHFHAPAEIPKAGGLTIINGSTKGTDEYAFGGLHKSGDAIQKLLLFHKEHGLCSSHNIKVN
jgi:hypothetical protein